MDQNSHTCNKNEDQPQNCNPGGLRWKTDDVVITNISSSTNFRNNASNVNQDRLFNNNLASHNNKDNLIILYIIKPLKD
jgi:hypothetical protein